MDDASGSEQRIDDIEYRFRSSHSRRNSRLVDGDS